VEFAYRTNRGAENSFSLAFLKVRVQALNDAFDANPARFKGRRPEPNRHPEAVWINPPTADSADEREVA